jgi:excisionase family DNA binding protein
MTEDRVLTKEEAASFLKVSERTLDYLIQSGSDIPFSRLSERGPIRFRESRLLGWMGEREGIKKTYNKQTK